MSRVIGTLLLVSMGVGMWLAAPSASARAYALERRWRGERASVGTSFWKWNYRWFAGACFAAAFLVGVGVLEFGGG
jgi:hypothetical protein